jgi:hypothetical protein
MLWRDVTYLHAYIYFMLLVEFLYHGVKVNFYTYYGIYFVKVYVLFFFKINWSSCISSGRSAVDMLKCCQEIQR